MQKGAEAIRGYCRRRNYADFVIEGGLDYLILRWERDVQEIATGYTGGMLDEYLNDMDGRRIINEVWPLASAEQVACYQRRLEEADKRFFAATVPAEACIWGEENEAKYHYLPEVNWWYYRVPKDAELDR